MWLDWTGSGHTGRAVDTGGGSQGAAGTLHYTSIDSLFDRPDVSPFSKVFNEYSTLPGIEHIYNELQANPARKRVETTIVLPPEQITPDLEQSTREAVRRYCLARGREVGQSE